MNMNVVIQCAAGKRPDAGTLLDRKGRSVSFVAVPPLAPPTPGMVVARPDDYSDDGRTWREQLHEYNDEGRSNRLRLLPAYELYANELYRGLVKRFGIAHVFILSAGWGLVSADFLLPAYDITFSSSAEPWMRRGKKDRYHDFQMIPDDGNEIVFLGGKSYLTQFCTLTARLQGRKSVFFNSSIGPDLPIGFRAVRYVTSTRTNWHYECARDLVSGRVALGT